MGENKKGESLANLRTEWEEGLLAKSLAEAPERKAQFTTRSNLPVHRVYTPLDLEGTGFDFESDVGFPGQYPYTRGITPSMYREKLWLMGQYGGFGTAEETNERLKYSISQGVTAFTIALDLPTQMGLDPDYPLALGEVGKCGVSISSLRDVEVIFQDVKLDSLKQVGTIANAIGPVALGWLLAIAEKKGVDPRSFIGFLQNEILKEHIARGAYFLPIEAGVKLVTDVLEYCATETPHWLPIMLCGYHFREAGATAAQELAFTLANAISYIDQVSARGLHPDRFVPQFVFFFSANMDLFEEVAKFRAFRRLWARLMKERYGVRNPDSMKARLHVYTAGSNLTAQQPLNNIVRVGCEALAAILGGVQYLFCSSMDEAFQPPSEDAVTVAIRTQQVLAHEIGITNTVDPMGGSYYVESLTCAIEEEVQRCLGKVESLGGAIHALENGYFHSEIARESFRLQEQIEKGEAIKVGVNAFGTGERGRVKPLARDKGGEARAVRDVQTVRRDRDRAAAADSLARLRDAAGNGENVVRATTEAVKAYATLGEICDVYRDIWGTIRDRSVAI